MRDYSDLSEEVKRPGFEIKNEVICVVYTTFFPIDGQDSRVFRWQDKHQIIYPTINKLAEELSLNLSRKRIDVDDMSFTLSLPQKRLAINDFDGERRILEPLGEYESQHLTRLVNNLYRTLQNRLRDQNVYEINLVRRK